ncbi:MAG: hypothetical protein ACREAA_15105 [Candidatus Polarisedimenticolia bacterium]
MPTLLLILVSLLGAGAPVEGIAVDAGWGSSATWDDGRAEVARYEATRVVYGEPRRFETVMITVKEDLDARTAVKADPPYEGRDLIGVLKINILSTIPAGNYDYRYMTSVFVRREDPLTLVKLTSSSQEWCGTTFKEVVAWDGPPRLVHHSYWDGQADGTRPLPVGREALLEEQLIAVARAARMEPGVPSRFRLHPTLITNSAPVTEWRQVTARLEGRETLKTAAGTFEVRRIDVRDAGGAGGSPALMTFWIEEAPRAAVVAMETSDGRSWKLKEIARRDYWTRS